MGEKKRNGSLLLCPCVCYVEHILHQNYSIDFLIRRFSFLLFSIPFARFGLMFLRVTRHGPAAMIDDDDDGEEHEKNEG